uniref:Uncharacterized protein n=1 Tax=Avena sativa TaxID=4498 RepID=A0ACD5WQL3_AVESA
MDAPTGLHKLRGPSPIVWAMRTRVAPPPQLAEPIPRPVYPPPPPPRAPLPPLPEKRRRGRPRKCDSLAPPPGFAPLPAARPTQAAAAAAPAPAPGKGKLDGLQPHVLTISAGEDIISRAMAVSQLTSKSICILSAIGAVKEAFLLQPSGVVLNHKGPLEIIRLSGSILTSNDRPCLRVTLASMNSFVISGTIAGPLIAASPIQAILGSFHNAAFWPNNTPRDAVACHPNIQGTVGNGSTLPGEGSNPESASCTSAEQNGLNEIDVKPSLEMLSPRYAACTSAEPNGSSEIDVKPSLEMLSPRYAACTSAEPNGSSEIDVKPFLGLNNPVSGLFASRGDTEARALDS